MSLFFILLIVMFDRQCLSIDADYLLGYGAYLNIASIELYNPKL